jgi:hypothetical protein
MIREMNLRYNEFEDLTIVTMNSTVFWDVSEGYTACIYRVEEEV